ncbi:Aste57867_14934 [Aphanomyces stellatus]|uniref:Aste57867_14934 protein n=1 Tax=Aphanomyces stellatus TaxID=120398 RepID=A0A485L3Q6_9STRA|nr:hypothetical protein As57867_014878 [Aphanomyces stellatus]VFT91749.1 Aste57867_14934 [Aphanomyces stellatus]
MVRRLHGSGDAWKDPLPMLPWYTLALALSAGMSLGTCFTVFKRANVMRDAGHGTMFMTCVCLGLWSIASLTRTFAIFMHDRSDNLELPPILHTSIATEVLFNATSIWFVLVAYEIQRRALRPRTDSSNRTAMFWYTTVVYGITAALLVAFVVLEGSSFQLLVDDGDGRGPQPESLVLFIIERVSWVTHIIRTASVLFIGGMAAWLFLKRRQVVFRKMPGGLLLIVTLFSLLHLPYIVIHPLCDTKVIDVERHPMLPSVAKLVTFSTGAVVSLLMGLSVASFDAFFHVDEGWGSSAKASFHHEEFFVLSDSSPLGRRRRI